MTTTLLIARHGNTFESGDTPRRVGARTDLPLTEAGREQGRALGRYLKEQGLRPDAVFVSELQRTQQTAKEITDLPCSVRTFLNEIDYGPDENKTEKEVIARLGTQALKDWDEKNVVPEGWLADPAEITKGWRDFTDEILEKYEGKTVLTVTSNGIARFAPPALGIETDAKLKLPTGGLGVLNHTIQWELSAWGWRR